MGAPPRSWVLLADWGNTLAGILLMGAFLEGALINSVGVASLLQVDAKGNAMPGVPNATALSVLQFLFCSEGFFYAVAEFFMIGIMAQTAPEVGGGARGCMQFAVLMAGGIFFAFSGLVFPSCITNITYVFSKESCTHPAAASTPYVWNAMAHYGITCFMVGTAVGFHGVLSAPKNKLASPFWGCTMYFLGAWTIGIFKFWGPVLLGGFDGNQNTPTFDFAAPAASYTANWWLAFLGAFFLFSGAVIFGVMNGSFGTCQKRNTSRECAGLSSDRLVCAA
eukprot:TRINITY_DN26660_c0_g1_i1.p1 TRINITY_DN26660_c0_g1~~TRINITY_DN26660_c0_g1_i1.p1  ORF type:complete len:309 (-),score=53.77 TRINITY_DN26660_c0_g1_i1:158-994(-)